MRIEHLLQPRTTELNQLITECSQFFDEAGNTPLYKLLPRQYNDVQRIKVRKRKERRESATFNEAFSELQPQLLERMVITQTTPRSENADEDLFFVFPSNGYKCLFSVVGANLEETYVALARQLGEDDSTMSAVLQYAYSGSVLNEGLLENRELLIYNMPFYYAVRANIDYDKFLTNTGV